MDHEEIYEYLTHRHELSDVEFEKEDGDQVFFTGLNKENLVVGIMLEAEHGRVNIYFVQDGQSWLEEVVTNELYDAFLAERMGI